MQGFEALLRRLAGRGPEGDGAAPEGLRREVETSLTPLIRCALERGVGAPALVSWVRRTLPTMQSGERTASALARQLCSSLVRQLGPTGGRRETVRELGPPRGRAVRETVLN
jgi:hypothetical protein